MKSSKQLREDIADLYAKAQALGELVKTEEREFNAEESKQFDAYLAEIGSDGLDGEAKSGLWAKVEQAEKLEKIEAQIKEKPEPVAEAPKVYAKPCKFAGRLKAFATAQDAYNAGVWFKANFSKNEDVRQAARQEMNDKGIYAVQTEGTGSAGGNLTPDSLAAAVINARENAGIAPQLAQRVIMPSDSFDLPKRSSGQTVYYPGEASAITASDKTYGLVQLTAVKRAVMTQISNELIADSLVNVMDDVAADAGHALAYQADNEFINGDGTSTYGGETGLVSSCAAGGTVTLASTKTAFTDIALADLHSCVSKVADKFWVEPNMAWIMRRSTFAEVIQKLVYAGGGNTVDSISGGQRPALFGYPIYFSDHMPASAASKFGVFFGNFNAGVVMGDRQGVEIASSADYAFNLDVMTLRLTARYDLAVHEAPGASSTGAFAGIKTAAS